MMSFVFRQLVFSLNAYIFVVELLLYSSFAVVKIYAICMKKRTTTREIFNEFAHFDVDVVISRHLMTANIFITYLLCIA